MKQFNELYEDLKGQLESMLKDDNIDTITGAVKVLDDIKERYNAQEGEMVNLKDKLVDVVKNTTFAKQPEGIEEVEKSFDTIMNEELNKIIANRK